MMKKKRSALAFALALAAAVSSAAVGPSAGPVEAATIGNVNMDGDAAFDSDSLADGTSGQYRWHSYPGARLTMNANQANDVKAPAGPIDSRLSLSAGGWFGSSVVNLNEIVRTEIAPYGGSAAASTSRSTIWYPYQIGFAATYASPSGTSITGTDTMVDANASMLRVIHVDSPSMNEVVLTGNITGSGGGQWIGGSDKVVLVSDAKYYYAIHIVSLSGPKLTPVELLETATISGGQWTYRKAFAGDGALAVGIGVAAASEGSAAAIARANAVFSQDVADTLADAKADMDGWLRSVPAPSVWGISGIDAHGVTSAQHQYTYYAAWAFLLQNLVNVLPENAAAYPYPQVMTGKPSLWNLGDPSNPGTSQWESPFGYQMLSYLMPETAWQAFIGLMTTVDSAGMMGGESLPSRTAQTAWILYEQDPNLAYLEDIYPALKGHLLWAGDNPRWICCGHNIQEEKDVDFVASWLFDLEFAELIAAELGETADVALWQNERAAMLANLDDWFFKDPDVYYGLFYDYTAIPKEWAIGNDRFKAQGLIIDDMPSALMDQLQSYYMSIHRPDEALANFAYHKYPNTTLIVNGLLRGGGHVQAAEQAKASLRDTIRVGEFGEAIIPTATGVKIESVVPSIFSAVEAIHLTWLLNGMQPDYGAPQAFSFGTSSLNIPNEPDRLPVLESFNDVSEWENTYNSFVSAVGGAGILRYVDVVGDSYGMAEKQASYNVDEYPMLTIKIGRVYKNASWALKVNDGGADVQLQGETNAAGEFTYNLKSATGWSGDKTFSIRVYVLGGDIKVNEINAQLFTLETFDTVSAWSDTWNATVELWPAGYAKITSTSAYGRTKRSYSYNVDDYPALKIKVDEVGGGSQWALKVNDGSGDIALQTDTSTTGELVYDLKGITGWSGHKTFDIVIYAVGQHGSYLKADYLNAPVHVFETFNAIGHWGTPSAATFSASGGVATLTATTAGAGKVTRSIGADTSRYTKLAVNVPEVGPGAQWALTVNDGGGEVTLESGNSAAGLHTYSLAAATGWSGERTFDVTLYVLGGSGKYVKVTDMRLADLN